MASQHASPVPGLPPCKRYVATHDSNGKSIYAESPDQHYHNSSPSAAIALARSFSVAAIPADLAHDADVKAYRAESGITSYTQQEIVVPSASGANLLVIDLKPGASSAMHRTVSIDFSICVIGEIDHELDGGEKVRLRPGDHIVQRGTMHRWSNPSTTLPARFVACTLPCIPFDVAGEKLKEVHLPQPREGKAEL
ncbi:hypothetical protein LTR62_000795 [Meristemomyces frigidus]|uniref:Cupin type-2 domain-containing protein n=1 Tax=Meristemomyces frigidus TaxID=1508187 RepID=A0AAN7TU45_9PEZI|nr:hypothetical protein LTR62_000795 [Meristemomyces frigidus]